jgi:transcriptional regulator with XRE-family HTH domain
MEESNAEMRRGIAQVLNSFTPGAIFSFGQEGFSMEVDDWKTERLENVDENRVTNRIAGPVSEFRNSDEPPWNDIENTPIDIYYPTEIQGQFFPMTMVCRNCQAVVSPKSESDLADTEGYCPRCENGSLRQLQFVLTHDCGAISNIEPAPCDQHGWDNIYLKRGDPDDVNTFGFNCRICKQQTKSLTGQCSGCGDYINEASPLQSGSVYYPQREVMVEIPPVGKHARDLQYGTGWSRVLMHAHLGLLDLDKDGVTIESVATRAGIDEQQISKIEQELQEVPKETATKIIETLRDAQGGLPGRHEISRENELYVDLPDDSNRYSQIGHELFTFLRSTKDSEDHSPYEGDPNDLRNVDRHPNPRSLSKYEKADFTKKYPQAGIYRDRLESINVTNAWVVDNFPLLSVVYGFTRDDVQASEVDLNSFGSSGSNDAMTVYGDRSPSEAIILEVDREAIIEWMLEAGELNGMDAPDLNNEVDVRSWFLENVDPTEIQNPFTPIEDETTEQVYQLLHTMSHALMGTASKQCGLDSDSISELILPTVPAIVLYAESMEHFALGGMFTLFKTRLDEWVNDAKKHAARCIYDPACINDDSGAACHACMHVSEFTCQSFNSDLNRQVLIGDGETLPAFWDLSSVDI